MVWIKEFIYAQNRLDALNTRQARSHDLDHMIHGNAPPQGLAGAGALGSQQHGRSEHGYEQTAAAQKQFEAQLQQTKTELANLRKRRGELAPAGQALYSRQTACLTLLRQAMRGQIGPLSFSTPPSAGKHQTLTEIRDKIANAQAAVRKIRNAPFPAAFIKERAIAQLRDLSRPININPAALQANEPPLNIPRSYTAPDASAPDAMGVLIAMFFDELVQDIDAEIKEISNDADAIDPTERPERIAAAEADLLVIEREEANLEWNALQRSEQIELRPAANPLAILNAERA
jgi:hypothetical protein